VADAQQVAVDHLATGDLVFVLFDKYLGSGLLVVAEVLLVVSLFAALLAFHNTAARYFYALGREGVLAAVLGRTSPKTRAPIYGSVLQTLIGIAVIALYVIAGWDPFTRMFFWLTVLGGLGVLILMTATSIAVLAYFARRGNRADVSVGRRVVAPVLATLALGAVLWVTLDQMAILLGVDPASPLRWQLPAIFAVAAVLGVVWALILKARRPQVYGVIGLGANSAITEPAQPVTAGW
jgi:amino acid transporter